MNNKLTQYYKTKLILTDNVRDIPDFAYTGFKNLKEFVCGESVERIGALAFANCSNLRSIYIPDSVKEIGLGAFSDCEELREVFLPDDVTEIPQKAFENCVNLVDVSVSDKLETIDENAFSNCFKLKVLDLSKTNLRKVKCFAFHDCYSLQKVIFPPTIEEIEVGAFTGCIECKEVVVPNEQAIVAYHAVPSDAKVVTVSSDSNLFADRDPYEDGIVRVDEDEKANRIALQNQKQDQLSRLQKETNNITTKEGSDRYDEVSEDTVLEAGYSR